jgi:hypothetical protein
LVWALPDIYALSLNTLAGMFRGATDEVGQLSLPQALEVLRPGFGKEPSPGLTVEGNKVTVGDKTYPLNEVQTAFVKALVDAGRGVWVAGPDMGELVQPRPDRIFKSLPEPIRAKIQSKTGAGYRLSPA